MHENKLGNIVYEMVALKPQYVNPEMHSYSRTELLLKSDVICSKMSHVQYTVVLWMYFSVIHAK